MRNKVTDKTPTRIGSRPKSWDNQLALTFALWVQVQVWCTKHHATSATASLWKAGIATGTSMHKSRARTVLCIGFAPGAPYAALNPLTVD